MEIPSIESLLFVLFLVLPGFIVIKFSDNIMGRNPFLHKFEMTIWSSFISVVLYIFTIVVYTKIINEFHDNTISELNLGIFLLIWLILIFIVVFIRIYFIEWDIFGKIRKKLFINSKIKYQPENSVWDAVIPGYSEYVIVYTSDGIKYGGNILLFTKGIGITGKDNKEIFLENPTILNNKGKIEDYEKDLKGLLLLESDIRRIEFLDKILEQNGDN